MNDVELMEKIKNIQGLLWRPFVDELLIRSKKWFQDRDHAADYIKQLEREIDEINVLAGAVKDAAEAKLAKAMETLRFYADGLGMPGLARAALAELEGKNE